MIPFEDLVAALDSWRARNGLPVGTTDVQATPRAETPISYAQYAAPAAALGARPVSPTAMPSTESDVMSIDDAEVEDEYDNEGDDFAMSFGQPAAAAEPSPAPEPAPAPAVQYAAYDDDDGYDVQSSAPAAEGTYDDPAYDEPQPVEAAAPVEEEAPPPEEEEDDDAAWARLYPGAAQTEEGGDEHTVVAGRDDEE